MTKAQLGLYWREWGLARGWFRDHGLLPKQADAKRRALHKQALGVDKSSVEFTNAEFDKVLGSFRAVHDGGNLDAQLRQAEQPEDRMATLRARARDVAADIVVGQGMEAGYLDGLARKVFRAAFGDLNERQLQQLVGILHRRLKQMAARNPF